MKNLVLSKEKINDFSVCPRLGYFSHILRKGPVSKPKYFSEGEFGHKCLEIYYLSVLNKNKQPPANYIPLFRNEALTFINSNWLTFEETEEIISHLSKYLEYYSHNETWTILGVEEPFVKLLWEDEKLGLRILFQGRDDLRIKTQQDFEAIVDHKFLSRRSEIPDRDNQKLGYCWAFGLKDFFINTIGKQKTLKDSEKFTRPYFSYSQHQIDEWVQNTIVLGLEIFKYEQMSFYPGRMTGCNFYDRKCLFTDVCNSTPDNWQYKLEGFGERPEYDLMAGKLKEIE